MIKHARASVLALICLSLQACVWAPGQHMDKRDFAQSGDSADGHYELVQITPKEIAMEQATSTAARIPEALLAYKPQPYRIGVGDSLYITVWDHPELTSPAGPQQQPAANGRLVRDDGTLFYPYAGIFKAAGMTVEELRKAITKKLAQFIENPQVDLNVIAYGSQRVTVGGAFVNTAPQPIAVTPLTLAQAVGAAKIDPTQANLSDLVLTRDGQDYRLDLDALASAPHGLDQIWLKSGDQLYLGYADRQEAYVMGEVQRPLAIPFKTTDLTLTQALGRAGGLNMTTSKGKAIYVIRGAADMEKAPATIYHLDAHSPSAFALASQFRVHAGDVVFVGPAGVTRWNRFLSQLLPLSGLISNTANANKNFGN